MVEEQIHSVLVYMLQSSASFVLTLNFQKDGHQQQEDRKCSVVYLTSKLGCFQQGAKNKYRSYDDSYHSEGKTVCP